MLESVSRLKKLNQCIPSYGYSYLRVASPLVLVCLQPDQFVFSASLRCILTVVAEEGKTVIISNHSISSAVTCFIIIRVKKIELAVLACFHI